MVGPKRVKKSGHFSVELGSRLLALFTKFLTMDCMSWSSLLVLGPWEMEGERLEGL